MTLNAQLKIAKAGEAPVLQPLLVSKDDAAKLLGICRRSVTNLINAKQLPVRRVGRRCL
jgi:hypothetical protein